MVSIFIRAEIATNRMCAIDERLPCDHGFWPSSNADGNMDGRCNYKIRLDLMVPAGFDALPNR